MIVKNDLFGIARRLKEVDSSYFVVFNGKNNKFELHGGREKGYILTIPFERLDARAVDYVQKTRVERINKLIAEIDAENLALEKNAMQDAKKQTDEQVREGVDRVIPKRFF